MGFRSTLKKQAMGLGQKAMERLFADEGRAQKVAEAIGTVQRGKQALDSTQRTVMHQLNFATKADFKDLGKQLSALRRRVKALDEKLSVG
jgi:polyhydroxyalkanoate synthesis regulator phasin